MAASSYMASCLDCPVQLRAELQSAEPLRHKDKCDTIREVTMSTGCIDKMMLQLLCKHKLYGELSECHLSCNCSAIPKAGRRTLTRLLPYQPG